MREVRIGDLREPQRNPEEHTLYELVDLDVCSDALEWHARVPTWRDHYLLV